MRRMSRPAHRICCFAFMNITKPPESCCKSVKQTIDTQLECLCDLYSTPDLLPSFVVNVTDALTLPARCGISRDLSACVTDKNGAERMIRASAKVLGLVLFFIAVVCFDI